MGRGRQHVGDQVVQRCGVAFDIRREVQALAAAHDGDAVVTQRAAYKHRIPGANLSAAQVHARRHRPDAARVDVDAVTVAAIHYFGVAGHHAHAGFLRAFRHGSADAAQIVHGKALFQNEGAGQVQRPRARGGHIVHRAAHGQTADVAAREEVRRHHEAVGGVGHALARAQRRQHRRVIAAKQLVGTVGLEKHLVDDALHHRAARPVAEHYLVVRHYKCLPVVVSTSFPFFTPLVPKMRLATVCTSPVSPRITITSRHMCWSTCTCIVEMMLSK